MPTSATGPSDRRQGGFTLVEVLVVMVILATLAATVSLTLPDDRRQRAESAVEAWRSQALWAADRSLWQGRAQAWEIGESEARVLEKNDAGWIDKAEREARRLALPDGLRVAAAEREGQALRPGERIVFAAGEVPVFSIRLESAAGSWRISGEPSGRIEWRRVDGEGGGS